MNPLLEVRGDPILSHRPRPCCHHSTCTRESVRDKEVHHLLKLTTSCSARTTKVAASVVCTKHLSATIHEHVIVIITVGTYLRNPSTSMSKFVSTTTEKDEVEPLSPSHCSCLKRPVGMSGRRSCFLHFMAPTFSVRRS